MKLDKLTKYVLFFLTAYYLYPSYGNGLFIGILSFFFYLVLLIIANSVISDGVNYITRNWRKVYLRWIDETEHAKGNSLANITRLDFIGMILRYFNFIRYNKNRLIEIIKYNLREYWIIYLCLFIISVGLIIKVKFM